MKRNSSTKSLKELTPKALSRVRDKIVLAVNDTVSSVNGLRSSESKLFNHLMHMNNHLDITCPSIAYLAGRLGYCERTIQRAVKRLEFLGLIKVMRERRSARMNYPNVYHMDLIFRKKEIRWRLGKVIPALFGVAMIFMLNSPAKSPSPSQSSKNVTLINTKNYINKHNGLQYQSERDYKVRTNNSPGSGEQKVVYQMTRAKYQAIQFLNPTTRARIEAELYSVQALDYARRSVRRRIADGYSVYDPFVLFFKYCEDYSRVNKLPINMDGVNKLKEIYKPKGAWSSSSPDVAKIKSDVAALRKKRDYQYSKSQFQPKGEPGPSTTELFNASKSNATEQSEVLPDCREEMATAVAKMTNTDGSYTSVFAAILAQGSTE